MDSLALVAFFFETILVALIVAGVVLYRCYRLLQETPPSTPVLPDTMSTEPVVVSVTTPSITAPAEAIEKPDDTPETEEAPSGLAPQDNVAGGQVSETTTSLTAGEESIGIDQVTEAESPALVSSDDEMPFHPISGPVTSTENVAAEPYKTGGVSEDSIAGNHAKSSLVNRPGRRPDGHIETEDIPGPIRKKSRVLKPEVVCWKKGRRWLIGLEMPEELQEYSGLTVIHEGVPITQNEEGQWLLVRAIGKIYIKWDEVDRSVEIALGDKPYLLFRLTGQNISRGRFVRYATAGSFLVVVPDQWQRDEEISEPASILPESVSLSGYQVHYFSLDRENDQKIAFRTSDGESVIIPTRTSRFELTGTCLPDATENIGPLFGEGPPRIRALDPNGWSEVETIVVGQEGPGHGRWRRDFCPEQDRTEQEFPRELSERCSGWYFVRFYDADDRLIESQDFRFVSGLKDIRISPHSALPGVNGHSPARVDFLHDKGCAVKLADSSAKNLSVEYEDGRTSATIPPDPIWDKTRWLIQPGGGTQVEAEVLVERVWWAIGEESAVGMLNQWTDMPLNISRDHVTATSNHALYFRLPRPRWAKEIRAGFERWKTRAYHVEVAKREVTVSLSHFEGAQEIEDRAHEYTLKLWIKDSVNQDISAVVAVIAEPPPIKKGRARADVRRMRNYLKRLERKTQDSALCQIIDAARERWPASTPKSGVGSYRIETACVIALAWEIFRADRTKPLGYRKRWLRKFVGLAANHPDTMQEIREKHETLKRNPTNASSRPKR